MHHRIRHIPLWVCQLALLLSYGAAHAEIYKWVDEQGRTHYSQSKADAERARGTQVPIRKQAPASGESRDYWDYVTDKSKQKRRAETAAGDRASSDLPDTADTPVTARKRYDGTDDAARCEYARDVLSGKLRLANGERMDEHWLKTAEADIARFCR
ncbi:MAG: DUF4124 domain-containing protein [Hylemonella sp.]|jgi:hypothetical protein|uniref:DUF4124 domain-containing protein n=1 Tax=Hylemonella sp. TaxID=2066020 RepID=UPI00391BABF5